MASPGGSDSGEATSAVAEHSSSRGSSVHGANGRVSEPQNLVERLAAAEKQLQETSRHVGTSVSSFDSEERDASLLAQQIQEDLERKGSIPSLDSDDNTVEGHHSPTDGGSSKHHSSMFGMKLRSGSTSKKHHCQDLLQSAASTSGASKSGSSGSYPAAHLLKAQMVKHNPLDEPTSSSSNSSSVQATMDLWQQLMDSQDAKAKSESDMLDLKTAIKELGVQHKVDMEAVTRRLKAKEKEEATAVANAAAMELQIEDLKAKHHAAKAELNHKALRALQVKAKEEEERGDLRDELVGAEARHKARTSHLLAELSAAKESQKDQEVKMVEKMQEAKKKAFEEQAALRKDVISSRTKVKNVTNERDVLKKNLKSVQDALKPQVDTLKKQLDVAHSEMRSTFDLPTDPEDAPDGTVLKEKAKVLSLKEQLANSKVQQKDMVDELSEMRLKMMGMQTEHNQEIGDLQMMVENANNKLELTTKAQGLPANVTPAMLGKNMAFPLAQKSLGFGRGIPASGGPKSRAVRKGLVDKLSVIEEDEGSFAGSIACSGNVSSDGADGTEGVGDLGDFDEFTELPEELSNLCVVDKKLFAQKQVLEEKVKSLQQELETDRAVKDKLREESIGKDAMHASKVERLVGKLQATSRERMENEEQLQHLREKASLEGPEEIDRLRLKLEQEKQDKWEQAKELAGMRDYISKQHELHTNEGDLSMLRHRLFVALETKRISDARAEDFKVAVENMEKQHEAIVAELRHQLQVAEGAQQDGDESSLIVAKVEDLRQQIKGLVEERNVLANTLEWKEVQWKNKFETMEMQQESEVADLKRCDETSIKERTKLEAENAQLRSQVEVLQEEKQQLEAAAKAQPQPPPSSSATAWLQRLRCPVRHSESGPCQSSGEAAHCQDMCWQILNNMRGVTALLCSARDFLILEASKTACVTWGSSALNGQSVLTLVNGPSRAAWLMRAFQVNQGMAESSSATQPRFVVRDIGCEEFTNKSGHVFDSTVITAHLPAEPSSGKSAAWLVIIEPQVGSNAINSALPGPSTSSRVEARRGNQRSSQSEVSSVNPSDSASNILGRIKA